jgi:hypothetical protein
MKTIIKIKNLEDIESGNELEGGRTVIYAKNDKVRMVGKDGDNYFEEKYIVSYLGINLIEKSSNTISEKRYDNLLKSVKKD